MAKTPNANTTVLPADQLTTPATATVTKVKAAGPDLSTWEKAGRNVRFQMLDGILFVAVDTSADVIARAPRTEKGNASFASTMGNINIPGTQIKLGLNAFTPAS